MMLMISSYIPLALSSNGFSSIKGCTVHIEWYKLIYPLYLNTPSTILHSTCLTTTLLLASPSMKLSPDFLCSILNLCYSKTSGQFHSVKGNAVEAVGNLTGAESWQTSGKEEHAAGGSYWPFFPLKCNLNSIITETEYNAARAKGYAEGAADRAGGETFVDHLQLLV